MVLTLAGLAGLISSSALRSGRRYALLGIAIVAAIVTPPDPISMLMLAGPIVRSSYRAGRLWAQSMVAKGRPIPESMRALAETTEGFAQAVG